MSDFGTTDSRPIRQLLLGAACAVVQALTQPTGAYADDAIAFEEIEVPFVIGNTRSADINERSEFDARDQVAEQYVAVIVEITKTGATPINASLVRGPLQVTHSSVKDLTVNAQQSTRVVATYTIPDPRFVRRERSVTSEVGAWVELDKATKVIYVPLSSLIDLVEIKPEPGRSGTVSAGGSFDPRPWATGACDGHDPNLFPNCAAVADLGLSPLP